MAEFRPVGQDGPAAFWCVCGAHFKKHGTPAYDIHGQPIYNPRGAVLPEGPNKLDTFAYDSRRMPDHMKDGKNPYAAARY